MGIGERTRRPGLPAAIVDIDGTLVDSNHHHAVAWYRALRAHGIVRELWRIHRHIGMGGDRVVAALAGEEVERTLGDAIRAREKEEYGAMIGEVSPMPGARGLLERLAHGGREVVLASSGKDEEVDHYLDLLGARDLVDAWTTADDVDATKPEPDLVEAALARTSGGPAVMIGDTTWDCIAGARAGVPVVAVLTGGFCEADLRSAGAVAVHATLDELVGALREPPLGRPG